MVSFSKKRLQQLLAGLLLISLTACGSNSSTPVTIPGTVTIIYQHNLVFGNSSTLFSTGYNAFGQLGNGTLTDRAVPGPLARYFPVGEFTPFAGFATGGDHSVAFINNSTVRSWGYNAFGQLGNNTTRTSAIPVKTVDISGIKAVAAGAYHSLALQSDGTLWSWGRNNLGQLGVKDSPPPTSQFAQKPIKVTAFVNTSTAGKVNAFVNISSIAANGEFSLAIADRRVWAWGANKNGQLGLAHTEPVGVPTEVTNLPDVAEGFSSVAAGGAFSLAVSRESSNNLYSWGNNNTGELGRGSLTITSTSKPGKVVFPPKSSPVIKAAAGLMHGLALLDNGAVWAWGYNFSGQLGNGTTFDSPVPVKVNGLPGAATDIRAFGSSSMAKVGGAWYCWGDNTRGQLGIPLNIFTISVTLPQKMSGF